MSLDYGMPIVLPPIGPLVATMEHSLTFAHESEEQREQYEEAMARYFGVPLPRYLRRKRGTLEQEGGNLRTPTSGQSRTVRFPPTTSPIKKDGATRRSFLPLDSPTGTDGSNETELSGEEEKLRVSRERNRLHAQRTRIRKRELLESLKDRIEALHDEFERLKQAFDFHATAVCLLRLGNVYDLPCVHKLEQVGVYAVEDRDAHGQLCPKQFHVPCASQESDGDDEILEQETSCGHRENDMCPCLVPTNAHGKRRWFTSSATVATNMLLCSKEERERVRRERNRLHARRARRRKKLVLEKSQQAVQELRARNDRLRSRLSVLVSSIYGADVYLDDADATT
ncbi:hypothetical protein PsorP6_016416 [Peronosclerospora sorghi]|uniref:Uncharacterized protein n=1 Tax=Peronosclerospora sorghi TaxID=230839 RepID=A0ACC0VQ89_9STRA|nr:hypothetical protein PsorP6_016416 [Peronosclerospora sorghi]